MTASLPQPPDSPFSGSEDDATSVDAFSSTPPRPKAPRRPASRAPKADAAAPGDTPDVEKPTPRASLARNAATTPAPRTPRTPAAEKPATPRTAAAKKPATPRTSAATPRTPAAKKPATPRTPAAKKPATPRTPAAKKPATPRTPAAKKPATPRTSAAESRVDTTDVPVVSAPIGEPGPPPPLPADLIVPPRPPLPSTVETEAPAGDPTPADVAVEEPPVAEDAGPDERPASAAPQERPSAEPADAVPPADTVTPEPEPKPGAEPEPEAGAGPEPDAGAEPEPEPEPEAGAEPGTRGADEPSVEEITEPAGEGTEAPAPAGESADDATTHGPLADLLGADEASTDETDAEHPAIAEDPTPADVVVEEPDAVEADASAVPALKVRNVTKTFGDVRAVDGVDLTVPAGSFYGLVGPNGAGKTTTLSIIAGLLRSDGGTVEINGVDAKRQARAAKKLIGVLPDRLRTFDRLTGRQLLHYYGALRGLPSPVVESRAADLARAFDLVEALGRPVSDYSAGMTKKVMLAGAMIHSPRLLVLDEPFEAVDPVSSGVILDILRAYVDHGGTVILSSHGMELVERVCSRVAVIVSGQVLAEGTVDEVRGESTLEERFLELSGGLGDVEGLEWLHTFSA